jgi:hypothetical protein
MYTFTIKSKLMSESKGSNMQVCLSMVQPYWNKLHYTMYNTREIKTYTFIFNDESTESFICLMFHSVLFSVFSIPLLFNGIDACIGHTCNTKRIQHNTVIPCASLYSVYYYLSSPIPSATRAHTYDYVTRFMVNIVRSSGPSSDVTIWRYDSQGHTKYNSA